MSRRFSFYFLMFFLTEITSLSAQDFPKRLSSLDWQRQKLAPGLVLKSVHTADLYQSKQYINVLMVRRKRRLSIEYLNSDLKPTSWFAENAGALAAVNAGFFNMKNGGSVTYLKVDDTVVNGQRTDAAYLTNSCLAVDERQRLHILAMADTAFLSGADSYEDALFTGPLLLWQGQAVSRFIPATDIRHPRTCACSLPNGNTLLITVDGRHAEAQGMTLPELTRLMQGLGCRNGINLDGGGSTTMWVKDQGIVNHPSDNKSFDAAGERKVANVILVN